jgi:D-galactarolactone cycloisomerase
MVLRGEAPSMKITKVRTHVLEAALSQPFAYSRAWYDTRTASLVEIETDTGLTGWGECYGPARMTSAVVEAIAPWLIGEDPLRTDALWQTVYARLRDHGQKESTSRSGTSRGRISASRLTG